MMSSPPQALLRRVVVTGMGVVSPVGNTLEESWRSLMENQSGVTSLEQALIAQDLPQEELAHELRLAKELPCQVAAPVKCSSLKSDPRTSRFVQLSLVAGKEAILHANLDKWLNDRDALDKELQRRRERVGVCIGSGLSSVRNVVSGERLLREKGIRRLTPHFVPRLLANSAPGRLSIEWNLQGPNHAASTACAAGAHSIGDAMRCIQHGDADIMLAGGSESCIDPISMAGFSRLRALSTGFNNDPTLASRPFDKLRDGFVMGEGSGILVLEELQHAERRGSRILCELLGYGLTGDASHVTAPDPNGRGAERAMRMAMERAGVQMVDYLNAHATSTPVGDDIEALTISRTMSSDTLSVSSTKGATGHLLGAAGAIEAAFTIMSLVDGRVPPTRNLVETDATVQFQHVIDEARDARPKVAMTNSFGFGGTNASLVFGTHVS